MSHLSRSGKRDALRRSVHEREVRDAVLAGGEDIADLELEDVTSFPTD